MKSAANVVIIGSGVTGLSTAYSLVRKGMNDIMILEKGYLASGASTRNGGGIRAQFATQENIMLAKASIVRFRKLGAELGANFWFRQGGYLFVAESQAQMDVLTKAAEFQNRFKLGTRIVDCDEVRRLVPEMVCTSVVGGSYRRGDGVLFPFPLLFGYAEFLRDHGVTIETHCEVTGARRGHHDTVLETTRGPVTASLIMNAAGGWSSKVGAMFGARIPTVPVRHQIMVSEPLRPFLDPMVVTLTDGFYISQGPRGELVGGITDDGHGRDPSRSTAHFCRKISKRIVSLFPRLSGVGMMRQWAGFYDMSPDANPILDELEGFPGAFVACGFSGHGFMISPAVGEFMAALMIGDKPPFPREPYKLARLAEGVRPREKLVIG